MGAAMALTRDLETASAIIAHLGGSAGGGVHPTVAATVAAITEAAIPDVDALSPAERQTIAGVLTSIFRQAADLVDQPGRAPGWAFEDPVILQATGRASMSVAGVLASIAPALDGLADRLARGGVFCDVGTGTGWLAIAAAGHWPAARIIGIDIFARALELAEQNVAASGVGDRVRLRLLDVCDLDDRCDLIWLPGPFLPATVVPTALSAARRCLEPGGWVAFGVYGGPPDAIGQSLADLRTIRSGGHPWTVGDAINTLSSAGFADAGEIDRTWTAPVRLIVGQQP